MEDQIGTGVMAAMGLIWFLMGIAMYLFMAFALMAIAKKTNTPNGWLAFIPIANIYLMTQIAKLAWWWILLLFVPFVNIFAGIYIWWKISENIGKPGWWSLLLLIPIVNLVIIVIMAWGKDAQPTTA
jgi:hypothetical protein